MARKKKSNNEVNNQSEESLDSGADVKSLVADALAAAGNFESVEEVLVSEAELETELEDEEALEAAEVSEDSSLEESELAEFAGTNIYTEEEASGFLPEATEQELHAQQEALPDVESVEGTELDAFESADIEVTEFVEDERLDSIIESILFASDRPVSLASIKLVFKGTNIRGDKIKRSLDRLAIDLASANRGISLEEVPGGYQLRTKVDNLQFITRTLKARQFKLSGPALEVLAIAAYKQPIVKSEIDDIRGVESGHLLRALMEKGLMNFEGKSDLPGKPMQYGTTKKFLEIFGLRNLKELPTLSQIDELLPEGMTEEEAKPTLGQLTDSLSQQIGSSYSEGEEELGTIVDQLNGITTSSDFFEQEKIRQRQKRDAEKAQGIRDAMTFNEEVSNRDRNWLARYDEALMAGTAEQFAKNAISEEAPGARFAKKENVANESEALADANSSTEVQGEPLVDVAGELEQKIEAFENDEDLDIASTDEYSDEDESSVDDDLAIHHMDEDEAEST